MSILIKGVEMPKDCIKCRFCTFTSGYWKCLVDGSHADFGGTCRPSKCPLVPVPQHGDLIDRDKLRAKEFIHNGDAYAVVMSRDIRNAPTIISSSEE